MFNSFLLIISRFLVKRFLATICWVSKIGIQENIIFIGDRHAWSEPHLRLTYPSGTNMPAESNWNLNIYMFKYSYFHILFAYLYTCRYPMGCRSDMSVSNEACRFQIGLRWSMSRFPIGLRSGMSVSDQACRSPIVIIFSWTRKNDESYNSDRDSFNDRSLYEQRS